MLFKEYSFTFKVAGNAIARGDLPRVTRPTSR